MEWKMSGMKGKFGSAKQKVFKVFRLVVGLGKENSNVSSPTPVFTGAPYETAKLLPSYSLDVELKKAEALMYWRMFLDQPK